MSSKKAVIGFSGGMDSTTLLAYYLEQGVDVHCLHFQYGSKHNQYEQKAVADILGFYKKISKSKNGNFGSVEGRTINIESIYQGIDSSLLRSGGRIPEGHYEDDIMKDTKVPGRNLILIAIMASYAEQIGAEVIGVGFHAGDYAIYPDCRSDFVIYASEAVHKSTNGLTRIDAPFINDKKADILKVGYNMEVSVPYYLTRTCYKDQELSCGKCGACQERLEGFKSIGYSDPILYQV